MCDNFSIIHVTNKGWSFLVFFSITAIDASQNAIIMWHSGSFSGNSAVEFLVNEVNQEVDINLGTTKHVHDRQSFVL